MEEEEVPGVYRHSLQVEHSSVEKLPETEELPKIEQCEPISGHSLQVEHSSVEKLPETGELPKIEQCEPISGHSLQVEHSSVEKLPETEELPKIEQCEPISGNSLQVEHSSVEKLPETEELPNIEQCGPISGHSLQVEHSSVEKLPETEELPNIEQCGPISGVYGHSMEVENSIVQKLLGTEEILNIEQCEPISELDDSQLVGSSMVVVKEAALVGEEDIPVVDGEMETEVEVAGMINGGGKRKRGRPRKIQTKASLKKKQEEIRIRNGGEKRKRGRPRKNQTEASLKKKEEETEMEVAGTKNGGGKSKLDRPPKNSTEASLKKKEEETEMEVAGTRNGGGKSKLDRPPKNPTKVSLKKKKEETEVEVARTRNGGGKGKLGRLPKNPTEASLKKKEEEREVGVARTRNGGRKGKLARSPKNPTEASLKKKEEEREVGVARTRNGGGKRKFDRPPKNPRKVSLKKKEEETEVDVAGTRNSGWKSKLDRPPKNPTEVSLKKEEEEETEVEVAGTRNSGGKSKFDRPPKNPTKVSLKKKEEEEETEVEVAGTRNGGRKSKLDRSPKNLKVSLKKKEEEEETEVEVAGTRNGGGKSKLDRQPKNPTKVSLKKEEKKEVEGSGTRNGGRKSKFDRPPKNQMKVSWKKEEEDVCFICLDGGDLVQCNFQGCLKAYHPVCVDRDEAFFHTKGLWNCSWHICNNCEKAAHYMCYMCTYSLCMVCIKEADISCVRGNKGFCGACMKTVMLIEKNEEGNKEMAQVDFDDKNSWEYLFKDYWNDLKGELSFTLYELTQARNPWKGSGVLARKEKSSDAYDANYDRGSSSDVFSAPLEISNSKRRKAKKRPKFLTEEHSISSVRAVGDEGASMPSSTMWASKDFLELVAHMKNGDKSAVSQLDGKGLMLEYIKKNNLRDPHRKGQIICDSRLENLFGKACVGHFEMLKFIESHFITEEDSQADDIHGGVVDTEGSQWEGDGKHDNPMNAGKDKRCKIYKEGDKRGPQTNLDNFAAIDVHNINLIYLRRDLMEDLFEDTEKLHDKVVGSFVGIGINGSGQKQDMYRLVRVVGTNKAAEPYKTGKKTTDIMLEIRNVDTTEVISIDRISNEELSEDECKRLRQSIRCGLISRLTLGEIQEKAMALQAVRINCRLEAEILRLSHLRDRASEKGRRKELRKCVEKLQILKTPEERQRRLQEIPEVHADPNMDPSSESEEDGETDDKKQDNYMIPRDTGFRKGRELLSPGKGGSSSNDTWSGIRKISFTTWEPTGNMSTKGALDKVDSATATGERMSESSWNQGRIAHQSNSWEKPKNMVGATSSEAGGWNSQAVVRSRSSSGIASETSRAPLSTGVALPANISETGKRWHYQDPSGKIQGPFSIVQLNRWGTTAYFPANLRIWRTEKQDDSIFLTDALNGKFDKEPPLRGSAPILMGAGAHQSSLKVKEPVKVAAECAGPSPTPAKPSVGECYSVHLSASSLEPTQTSSDHDGTLTPESGQQTHASISPHASGKPSEESNGSGASGTLSSHQTSVSKSNISSSLTNQSFPGLSTEDDSKESSSGLAPPTSVANRSGDLTLGSEKDFSSSLNGSSPKCDREKVGVLISTGDLQLPSQSTMTDEPHGPVGVLDPQKKSGRYSPTRLTDASADVPRVKGLISDTWPDPLAPDSVGTLTNAVADSASNVTSPSKTAEPSLQNFVSSVNCHKPSDEIHGWGYSSAQESEMVGSCPISGSESHDWGTAPAQGPHTPRYAHAAQKSELPTYSNFGDDPSSVHNYAAAFTTGDRAGNYSTRDFLVSGSVPSGNWVSPPSTKGSEMLTPTAPPPINPFSWDAGPGAAIDSTQNIFFAPSDPRELPISSNQLQTASNIQPPAPSSTGWGMDASEDPSNVWRLGPENPNTGWQPMQRNANMGCGGSAQRNMNTWWGTTQRNVNTGWGSPAGNSGMWGSQPKHDGERFSGQGDRGFQGGNSGYRRGRPSRNRWLSFGGGGGSSRPPPIWQRVCIYHERGHCKKGAFCRCLHN